MVSKATIQALLLLASLLCALQPFAGSELHGPHDELDREKRTLVYTINGATGVLFAVSVPLLITGRNIFMAYNFEANYGMPAEASDFTQGILKRVDNTQLLTPEGDDVALDQGAKRRGLRMAPNQPPVARFTRKKLYRAIELNLARHGYDGKKCILRMICELASWPADEANGVIGDLLQLVFTPSSSRDEKLPSEFYLAEQLGGQQNCLKYTKHCPKDPLDAISLFF